MEKGRKGRGGGSREVEVEIVSRIEQTLIKENEGGRKKGVSSTLLKMFVKISTSTGDEFVRLT